MINKVRIISKKLLKSIPSDPVKNVVENELGWYTTIAVLESIIYIQDLKKKKNLISGST